jgi:S-adenosylmethionine hydrolase
LRSRVVYVDTFGNVKLAGLRADLEAALGSVSPGDRLELEFAATERQPARVEAVQWRATFGEADVGEVLLYQDSYGRICLAENQGDAASDLGLVDDQDITIRRA